jgi:hypothetical protein
VKENSKKAWVKPVISPQEKAGMISTAVRNIYLVRHGQYEIAETEPQKRILTGFLIKLKIIVEGLSLHQLAGSPSSRLIFYGPAED